MKTIDLFTAKKETFWLAIIVYIPEILVKRACSAIFNICLENKYTKAWGIHGMILNINFSFSGPIFLPAFY